MTVKICLLIADDPDDHQAFSEALSDYEKTIVLIILDGKKALELIRAKLYLPDYIFVDLSMHGIAINTFLKTLRTELGRESVSVVVYGDEGDFDKIQETGGLTFFGKDYEFSELKNFLIELVQPSQDTG